MSCLQKYLDKLLKRPTYGDGLNPMDIAKSWAILWMIIDHIGYYFYPDQLLWRVFGHWCIIVWFMALGCHATQAFSPNLAISAALLTLYQWLMGYDIWPLHILWSMLLLRMVLVWLVRTSHYPLSTQLPWFIVLCLGLPFYNLLLEQIVDYGLLGLPLAWVGAYLRTHPRFSPSLNIMISLAFLLMVAYEWQHFGFSLGQGLLLTAGLLPTMVAMVWIASRPNQILANVPRNAGYSLVLQLLGRHSLTIYIGHIMVILALAR